MSSVNLDNIVDIIHNATKEACNTMLGVDLTPGETKRAGMGTTYEGLSAIIGVAGGLKGMIAIHCPEPFAKFVAGTMLGMEIDEVNDDVCDAVGELSNVLAGSIKSSFSSIENVFDISLPTVITGENHTVDPINGKVWILAPFEGGGHHMQVGLCLEKSG